ncbi:MAG: glutamate synthase large subunit [Myxococcales bacterium]|nr:glutamate synthase large subunit [Myxococcales bacterium]
MLLAPPNEHSACGVGFVASRRGEASHETLQATLKAIMCVEHRGGFLADGLTGDGCGVMVDIPFDLLGYQPGEVAVATLFVLTPPEHRRRALDIFEQTFLSMGLEVVGYRAVPTNPDVLGPMARETQPEIIHAIIAWPQSCRTDASFSQQLYLAKQRVRTTMKQGGISQQFYFTSLSTRTIVYKALTRAEDLPKFYDDLRNPAFKTRFGVFHRRFSTNTRTDWDKAQPFRMIAHNGEINTIKGNQSSAYAREQNLGLPPDELLTHHNASDSGSLNGMVEALKYRSSMPHTEDVLAIMVPPAARTNGYYAFWSRAMEAWDGPAFISYCDGLTVGARLDRNGFRPCRWSVSDDYFYLASEAGVFTVPEDQILAKGALSAGSAIRFDLESGEVHFRDPSLSRENESAGFDARLSPIPSHPEAHESWALERQGLYLFSEEEKTRVVLPMIRTGLEPIGSMGDTARLTVLSEQPRSFFDFFYQTFAQVTNPPLDYLRERLVTDLEVHLGKQPNIFSPKELLPPMPGITHPSPILDLGAYAYLRELSRSDSPPLGHATVELHTHFSREGGAHAFRKRLSELGEEAIEAVRKGARILLLTDRLASPDAPPLPALLALRSLVRELDNRGARLECSIVVASGEVRTSHHVAALISFGATAVCPVLPLELAEAIAVKDGSPLEEARNQVLKALEGGLLKIMSKMGISVARSYRSSKLFCTVGLGEEIIRKYFRGLGSPVGGYDLNGLAELVLKNTTQASPVNQPLPNPYLMKEQARLKRGELHSMTSAHARQIHAMLEHEPESADGREQYAQYLKLSSSLSPTNLRHLFQIGSVGPAIPLEEVEPEADILRRFGAGAMSYGAINAKSQRDIIKAMEAIGARSNSGEGGENPYYAIDGTCASTKQVASGRFGVTAQYLISGDEIEIKIAQGAKPGEGGQLMAVKVDANIAHARHSTPGVDLISPPPMHDIYSIEDLKQLIFELRQLAPDHSICVKLVAGVNIGTIAAGVVKAGADIIQISGGDGGTGAATLVSMKHSGIPWEIGLAEVHQTLCEQDLRNHVSLRVDGGLSNGTDIVIAAALGADEFGFGKLLLVAQGCIMARVCEQNTCPRGIATHAEKFTAKYRGDVDEIIRLCRYLAQDVRNILGEIGVHSLDEIIGRSSILEDNGRDITLMAHRGLNLERLKLEAKPSIEGSDYSDSIYARQTTELNQRISQGVQNARNGASPLVLDYGIRSTDRAIPAHVCGQIAKERHLEHIKNLTHETPSSPSLSTEEVDLRFTGSAGQGFGVFMVDGLSLRLEGEANDSVCKSMSGGRVVIVPATEARLDPEISSIIGNCALYGATGGELFVRGHAGDRFAVRNSGATTVVHGVGMHACGYMTAGTVLILDQMSHNVGAGMTGGEIFCRREKREMLNRDYITPVELTPPDVEKLIQLITRHMELTQSTTARSLLEREDLEQVFMRCIPLSQRSQAEHGVDPESVDAIQQRDTSLMGAAP